MKIKLVGGPRDGKTATLEQDVRLERGCNIDIPFSDGSVYSADLEKLSQGFAVYIGTWEIEREQQPG